MNEIERERGADSPASLERASTLDESRQARGTQVPHTQTQVTANESRETEAPDALSIELRLARYESQLEDVLAMETTKLGIAERRRPSRTSGPRGGVEDTKARVERARARVERVQLKLDELRDERGN